MGVRAGLSASFLCDLERGKRGVGADGLIALAQALSVPIDQLATGTTAGRTADALVRLPASLMRFAAEADLPFRHALCLHWMQRTIMGHRPAARRVDLERIDWVRFHAAVAEFL